MSYDTITKDMGKKFEKAIEHLQHQLKGIRTGRASASLIDNIKVDYYGTPTPIAQVAQISVPEARQLIIKPFDISLLKEVGKALQKSDLGVSPQDDGKVVRLNLPPLSGEQRAKYAAKVKDICEEARVSMRNGRRELNKQSDAMLKSSEITEDENKKLHTVIQDGLKKYEGKVGEIQKKKTTEILDG
ncbi:MAG: ribosome recycling factor [Planctomycetota bacterium]|jgi:ribosome recycling factor